MRFKVLVLLIMVVLMASVTFAGGDYRFATFLSNATAPVVGDSVDMSSTGVFFKQYSCEVEISDNSTSAVVVAIEGNQSCGPRYAVMAEFTLTTNERAAQIGAFSIVDMPARCIRARLKTLTGGAGTSVTVRCTGVK
jgi:hypothetical protein